MFNTTFLVVDKVIQVRTMSEFVPHLDCVKLIDNVETHKHSCALKPLPILNTGLITNFLPTSLSTCLN